MFSIFGDLFDFNNDGKLDLGESAAEMGAFAMMMDDLDADYRRRNFWDDDDDYSDRDIWDDGELDW